MGLTYKEMDKYVDELAKHKYKCKCGHKVFIDKSRTKAVCDWCGKYVFKNKKDEINKRINENLKK